MRTRMRTKLVPNLSAAEWRACSRLCLRDGGEMAGMLRYAWESRLDESRVIMLEDEQGLLLGWALIVPDRGPERPPRVDLYVRASHRRRGLGNRLLRAAERYGARPRVCGWDPGSKAFFAAYGRERLVLSYRA